MTLIDQDSFAEALVVYARQEIERDQGLKAHLTPEKLAAYHADELSEAEDLEIQRHLAICTECPALLIDLEDLFDPRQRDLGLSDTGVASAWQDLRSRLGGKGTPGGPRATVRTPWWAWFSAALKSPRFATGLAVLCVGLGMNVLYLRENQASPIVNPATEELRSDQTRSGGAEKRPPTKVELLDENDGIELLLGIDSSDAKRFSLFIVRILDARGQQVDDDLRAALRKPPQDQYKELYSPQIGVTLQRSALDPGVYTIQVFGAGTDNGEPLEAFDIEVVHIKKR